MTIFEKKRVALARRRAEEEKVVVRKSNTDEEIMGLYHIAEILEFYDYNCSEIHAVAGEYYVCYETKAKTLATITSEQYILYRNTITVLKKKGYDVRIHVADKEKEVEFTYKELEDLIWQNRHH